MKRSRSRQLLCLLLLAACRDGAPSQRPPYDAAVYAREDAAWKVARLHAIAGPEGWITLAGLHWLDHSRYSLGGPDADLRLPEVEGIVGTLLVDTGGVHFAAVPGSGVTLDGSAVDTITLRSDAGGTPPTVLTLGSTTFRVIDRSGHLALRVKDTASTLRRDFAGIESYPVDTALRVLARLERPAAPRVQRLTNIVGLIEEYPVLGTLHFLLAGEPRTLDAVQEPGDSALFILFRDATSQTETYPAGRFLGAPLPDTSGLVILDFNRAYNPPCAFTAFATCPLPPPQNVLPVPVRAGERRYAGGHTAVASDP